MCQKIQSSTRSQMKLWTLDAAGMGCLAGVAAWLCLPGWSHWIAICMGTPRPQENPQGEKASLQLHLL